LTVGIICGAIPYGLGYPKRKESQFPVKVMLDSYFTNFQDLNLTRQLALKLIREVMAENKIIFDKIEQKACYDVSFFMNQNNNIIIRMVWIHDWDPPIMELGLGQETNENKIIIKKLKKQLSNKFRTEFKI
jgi:hypothetical protein